MKLSKFVTAYKNKNFDEANEAWCDWFCNCNALVNRMKNIAPTGLKVAKALNLDGDTEMWMKNCCPVSAPLYDIFNMDLGEGKMLCLEFYGTDDDYNFVAHMYKNYEVVEEAGCNKIKDFAKVAVELASKYVK